MSTVSIRAIRTRTGLFLYSIEEWLNKPKIKVLLLSCLFCSIFLTLGRVIAEPYYELVPNRSNSLPGYLYILDKTRRPDCGDKTSFKMPVDARFFPGYRLIKIIRGCPGDVISVDANRRVFINQTFISGAMPTSSDGEHELYPVQSATIPLGHVYLHATHPRSYDSRYSSFGLRSIDELEGTIYRIL